MWFSSKLCRRCGAPKPTGAPSSPVAAAKVQRRNRKRGTRPTQKPSTPPEVNLAKVLDGLKDNEHFKDSEELAAIQAKMEQAWEADKLAKRQARTPEVAVQSALSALQHRKAAMAKSQDKISELEAAARKATEAVDEAKQKAEKLQGEIDKLQKEYDEELARLAKPSDRVTHLQSNVRVAFQALSGNPEAQPLIAQLETAFTGLHSLLAAATPTPMAIEVRDDEELQPGKEKNISHEALAVATAFERSLEACPRKSERPRRQRWWSTSSKRGKFSHLKRHINTVYCVCSVQAASGKGPSLESLAKILVGEGSQVASPIRKTSWTNTTANVTSWKSGQSDFWALQETHLPGSEQMATAQRWLRKRGWAAAFQGAEVVGEHYVANGGGVAIAGPQDISSSVSNELEAMLREAADLAPEGLEHPLQYLRSRILARHIHAMLKRGVTLVTVYLEPGLRASGLNLWLLEVLAACILCFDGPWIALAGLEYGAEGFGPSWLARHGQRQGRRHIGCYLCRGSRSCPRLLRAVRGRWHTWCNRSKW